MTPENIGRNYDKLAAWWQEQHRDSDYGVPQLQKALQFCVNKQSALDVGCGAGGRFIHILQDAGFRVHGIDVSTEMIALAQAQHPDHTFIHADICDFTSTEQFDLIVAWDSIFHLPYDQHAPVITKLCSLLKPGAVLMYSFGDADGAHEDQWHEMTFAYSSIGIAGNLEVLTAAGMAIKHLEIDQWPERHVYVIGQKPIT